MTDGQKVHRLCVLIQEFARQIGAPAPVSLAAVLLCGELGKEVLLEEFPQLAGEVERLLSEGRDVENGRGNAPSA